MEQNGPLTQKTTIAQKTAMVAAIALFFATPVIILLRRKSGYRFLNPTRVFAMTLVLLFYGIAVIIGGSLAMGLADPYAPPSPVQAINEQIMYYASGVVIIIFAVVVLATGMLQRWLRWRDIKRGVPWHTYSRGVSWLSFLPLSDNKIKRFIDPAVCIIAGAVAVLVNVNFLGYYLFLAGAFLFIFEAWDYDQALTASLDMLDSMVESEVMGSNVEYYTQEKIAQRPLEQTAGIPTGVAPDIEVQIQRRRARQTPPNNLASTTTALQP